MFFIVLDTTLIHTEHVIETSYLSFFGMQVEYIYISSPPAIVLLKSAIINAHMKNKLSKFIEWYKALPTKKSHVEFITAVLSVPVMLTVIILNLNNLNQQKKQTANEKISPIQVIITGIKENGEKLPVNTVDEPVNTPTPLSCVKEVGPVSIFFPRENEVVTKDPLCITVVTQSDYCSLVWSYNLNDSGWSDYTDKNICLHNLTNGDKTVQLKIKSTVSQDSTTLQRSFIYQGNNEPTTSPVASSSAQL
ncbi:hypothetical protein COY90_05245 [Candidatus Roizmanbacteria bacterium CG_4_10_14_0_8_um_filter_39_9]|uniref:Uncharacterized protein n=1 Tax=Candidatus Roizmanbacteria bacterium CG_4_10_14_0_8_um_filter_39_9 TaxID=1974829 RepID=A0A2M7QCJ0_9BACT|nr:MAG: hypothetical protein COY90_05245 [Candidatus Roizmanbacteria bacterium CG_4_10_14_0_8_um_filter_39_9]